MTRHYQELDVWQRARVLVSDIYRVTATFPKEEMFGLTSQMRRAAVSIPSNIAEGAGRSGPKEFARFLYIARASLYELETQLILANDLGFLPENEKEALLSEIGHCARMIQGLIRSTERK